MKNIIFLIGNGVTIDLLNFLKISDVNVKNLFQLGAEIKVPLKETKGFLSAKHCPNLWMFGARPGLSDDQTLKIIENIITCGNVLSLASTAAPSFRMETAYATAYHELTSYVRALFVDYNSRIDIASHQDKINDWGWLRLIKKLYDDTNVSRIYIITFNYDIFLERILLQYGLDFSTPPFQKNHNKKIEIIKPHGSIAFIRKDSHPSGTILRENFDALPTSSIEINFSNLTVNDAFLPLIPPAGDSARGKISWVQETQDYIKGITAPITNNDHIIIGGLSYWSVDRLEIDSTLISLPDEIECTVVNPFVPETLNMVVSSLFKNYTLQPSITEFSSF